MRIRMPKGRWRCFGLGMVGLVVAAWFVRSWVVPALIVGQIRSHYRGRVTLRGWWLDARSAGLVGLTLHEGPEADSPVWAVFPRVTTDLSLGGMVRGRFVPGRVTVSSPELTFRLDRDARPLTRIPWKGKHKYAPGRSPLPNTQVRNPRLTVRQEGRPEMVISGVDVRLAPDSSGRSRLSGGAVVPGWGRWDADGEFAPGFGSGEVRLIARDVLVTPDQEVRLPFIPADVWKNVVARGPVDLRLNVRLAAGTEEPIRLRTTIDLRRTAVTLPVLGLEATETTGEVVVEDKLVTLKRLAGRAMGGGVATDGTMDFTRPSPRFDLTLKLDGVNVSHAPRAWKLDRLGIEGGRMTGTVGLRATMTPGDMDLSGSWGDGVIRGATLQGLPVKSFRLVMRPGQEVRYEAGKLNPKGRADEGVRLASYQTAPAGARPPAASKTDGGLRLPGSFSTEMDMEDVELSRLVDKAAALGIVLPVEVAGRFSLKANATIPVRALRDIKAYVFRGRLTLAGASIAGVDLGRAAARIDLEDGVLDVSDLNGRLVDLPDGGRDKRPAAEASDDSEGPLPPGGFRGRLRAELSPRGRLTARLEANRLPLGELAAPVLPRPTPLSGRLSFDLDAAADVASLARPKAWTAAGSVGSERVTYRATILDAFSARFSLAGGSLTVAELSARLGGRPLAARLKAQLEAPYAYDGKVDVADWSLDDLLTLAPGVPQPPPAGGTITLRAEAHGTLSPWSVTTEGRGRLARFRAGPVPLGDVPFEWSTGTGVVVISGVEARTLGGLLTARGRVPTGPGGSATGTISLIGMDTALLAAAMPENRVKLAGSADVRVSLVVPTDHASGAPSLAAEVQVSAPDLTVQGVPTRALRGSVNVRDGVLVYKAVADSLDAKVKFEGELPLSHASAAPSPARLEAGWFSVGSLWQIKGVTGPVANLQGMAAVVARLDLPGTPSRRRAVAAAEVRGLRWDTTALGNLRGIASVTPTEWRVTPLTGDLLGGIVQGDLWGTTDNPDPLGFSLKVDRFDLARLAELLPWRAHDRDVSGRASVRLEGRPEKAKGEIYIEQARVHGLPVADLRVPAEFHLDPETGEGAVQVRESSARLAGGHVRCDARLRFGAAEDFRTDLRFYNLDLKSFKGVSTNDRRPASGKVSGRVSLESPSPGRLRMMRGKAHLDLTDASLFELPVFRQISQFLGSEQGGIFEAGDADITLAGGKVKFDRLALVGRLIQLRAKGTIGLNAQLDLEVIVKTNQVIPQTGRAVVATVLGLGRGTQGGDDGVLRTSNRVSNGPVKLRITGTLKDPKIRADPSAHFDDD